MNKKTKKVALIIAWIFTVPVFIVVQVSFLQDMTKKANAGDVYDARIAAEKAAQAIIDDAAKKVADEKLAAEQKAAEEERQAALDKANDEKDSLENKLKKETAALLKLQQQKAQIGQSVSITQIAINKTQSIITDTAQTISRKEAEVKNMQEKIELQKTMLIGLLQQVYYNQSQPILSIVLTSKNFADVFSDIDHLLTVGDKLKNISIEIAEAKSQIEQNKAELAIEKQKHEEILADKVDQKQELVADQIEVQGDIQEKEKTISQLQSQLNSLKSEYSRLLGKSISTDDILEAAKFAASATNMNKSFLLGVLVQESNKGQNVGTCDYKQSNMTATQLNALKQIAKELDYDYKKLKFSCPPKNYKGTGGAMGVGQFMPTTWLGYKGSVGALTGHNPPDPWSLIDGVTAMASKLSKDGASKKTRFDEAKSYCVYLAGGNWGYYCFGSASKYKKSYTNVNCWGSSIKNYGEKVLCLKDNYEQYY